MLSDDSELVFLAAVINSKGLSGIEITVSLRGTVITGTMVNPEEYFSLVYDHISKQMVPKSEAQQYAFQAVTQFYSGMSEKYYEIAGDSSGKEMSEQAGSKIFLKDAQIVSGTGYIPRRKGMLWSIAIANIDGFSLNFDRAGLLSVAT